MAWTNRGVKRILDIAFRAQNIPTHWYAVLCTDAAAPARTTNTMAQLTRNTTDWVDLNEDDSTHFASTVAKDVVWTASGGTLPSSGTARYLVITDDHATLNSREIIAYFDLGGNTSVSSGQPLTAVDLTLKLSPSA
jgi:hypothetical protein